MEAGFLMQSYGGVWKNQLEWKEDISVYATWRDVVWGSLKKSSQLCWQDFQAFACRAELSLGCSEFSCVSPAQSLLHSAAKPDKFCGELWGLLSASMQDVTLKNKFREEWKGWLCQVQILLWVMDWWSPQDCMVLPSNKALSLLQDSSALQLWVSNVILQYFFKIPTHKITSEEFPLQVYYLDCPSCNFQRPKQFLQLLTASGAQLLEFLET